MDIDFINKTLEINYNKSYIDSFKETGMHNYSARLDKIQKKISPKITKNLTYSMEYNRTESTNIITERIKNNLNDEKYSILKIDEIENNVLLYVNIYSINLTIVHGVAVIEISDKSKVKLTIFYGSRLYIKSLNINKEIVYFDNIINSNKNVIQSNKDINNSNMNINLNSSIETYKYGEDSIYPLKKEVYLDKSYIHPAVKNDLDKVRSYDTDKYEKAERIVLNNNYQLNTLNKYVPAVIASNLYQEKHFPIIGEQPDLEEFTSEYVWFDEKIYFHTLANEYVTYDTPDIYMSTATSFGGNVSFGTISKAQSGKKDAGWSLMSSGDFYITERQILIFEKGSFSLGSFLFGGDNLKRNVFPIYLSDIKLVEGDSKRGALKIYRNDNTVHAFGKSNHNRNEIKFSEDELRYLVNLIGSLIEKL